MSATGNFWVRWRVRLGYPLALLFVLLAQPTTSSLALGALVGLVGLFIRAAAAGHLRKHELLSVSGPYAYTRNPLYFGSAILAGGIVIAGGSWIAAVLVALYFAIFYPLVMKREEGELRARYAADYDDYARRVPLFLPRLRGGSSARGGFSWAQYARNREYQALLGFLAGLALLYAKMLWWV
jgi:protein-S-isoprenylcysteine O-methyltransferase Ste14